MKFGWHSCLRILYVRVCICLWYCTSSLLEIQICIIKKKDGTKQGKALYIGVANLQAVGAWVIFCPAAVQLLLRRRGRLLAPPSPAAGSTSTVPKGDAPSASRLSQCMFVFLDACTRCHVFFQDLSGWSSSSLFHRS